MAFVEINCQTEEPSRRNSLSFRSVKGQPDGYRFLVGKKN